MSKARWFLPLLAAMPLPALAREPAVTTAAGSSAAISTPAGTAAQAAIELARQTGSSIVIADGTVARRSVPALRGRMSAQEAVRRLARSAGARAVAVAPQAWRIEAVPVRNASSRAFPPLAPPRADKVGPPSPPEGPPIIVVASKRDLTIAQLPGQVSVLDGASLEVGGIGGTEKITQRLPTVTSTHLGSGRNKLFIRGIADSSFTGPTQATVGQYLGDLRLTYNAPDPDLRLSDMAHVEVLEGPQGTLYGAGSLGGIIRLVPNLPVLGETSGTAIIGGSLTQDGAPGADVSGTLNVPLGSSAALRANIDAATLGGYIDKPRLGRSDVNRSRILGGRASLRARLAPDWTVDAIALAQGTDALDSQYAARIAPPLESAAQVREGSDARYALGQVVVSGRIGALHVRSTTGTVQQRLEERYDATSDSDLPRLFTQTNRTRMLAHETRIWQPELGGFGWLAGVSFTRNRTTLSRRFDGADEASAATGVHNSIHEMTFYGEASYTLRPGLTATAGGRLTRSRLAGSGEDVVPAMSPAVEIARAALTADRNHTQFLPSAAINAQLAADSKLYWRYQEGFRPGGFAIEGNFVRRFRNDHTQTYEFGARHGRPGESRFDLALSLSYTRWHDIQADFIDGQGLPSTANIGDGRVWSASASGGVLLLEGLRFDAGVTWNKSKVDQPSPELMALAGFAQRSMQIPNIASFSGRAGLSWNRELGRDVRLTAGGWASYVGRSRLGIGPELGEPQGDYLDSGLDLRIGSADLGVTLSVTNLVNERGNRFSLGTPFGNGRDQTTPLRPRTVRLGLDARF